MFPQPETIDTYLIRKCGIPEEEHLVQAARVRQAINALRQAMETEALRKRKALVGDDRRAPAVQFAATLKDGKPICRDFQVGMCQNPCPKKKLHVCAMPLKNNRVCGMANHQAADCKARRKLDS